MSNVNISYLHLCFFYCRLTMGKNNAVCCYLISYFFFFKQKTAYEMRISDWSSDVCSSDLIVGRNVEKALDLPGVQVDREHAVGARGGDEVGNEQIGRASCRERVCQYV